MARQSFRVSFIGALAVSAAFAAAALSGCTKGPPPGQAAGPVAQPPVAQAPLPAPPVIAPKPLDIVTAGRAKVALLVPLTGPNKPVGQAMLDAANMALFDVSADLALLPRDSGGGQDEARAAAQKALADGAGLILGPVFATSVPPVRQATQATPISVISYSTDATVAGGNVFMMGFLPAQQVERVVGFAKSRGMTSIAVLVPDNPYGAAVTGAIAEIQGRLGLQPPRVLTLARDAKAQITSLADDPPQALLVALGGDQLLALAPAIAELTAAHPMQLLGTGLWDDPALSQVPALAGGWYAAPVPDNFVDFAKRFQQIYNYRPPRIATLAYDSVALATSIARSAGGSPNPFSREVLLKPNGFAGVDGSFRFLPSGLSRRNLAVLALGPDGPVVVDPPPPSFEPIGE